MLEGRICLGRDDLDKAITAFRRGVELSEADQRDAWPFLYLGRELMRRDVEAADRMLVGLSNLLRVTLASNTAHEIPLRQELDFLEKYLEIEQTRFRDRLTVRMRIEPEAIEAMVPHLIFQPLVENAIRHGIRDRESGGLIEIRAERRGDKVYLEVRDDGPGIEETFSEGVGLSNTRARLEYLYGADGKLDLRNNSEGGLVASAQIPFRAS